MARLESDNGLTTELRCTYICIIPKIIRTQKAIGVYITQGNYTVGKLSPVK